MLERAVACELVAIAAEEIARIHEEYRRIAQVAHVAQRHTGFRQRPLAVVLALAAAVIAAVVLGVALLF